MTKEAKVWCRRKPKRESPLVALRTVLVNAKMTQGKQKAELCPVLYSMQQKQERADLDILQKNILRNPIQPGRLCKIHEKRCKSYDVASLVDTLRQLPFDMQRKWKTTVDMADYIEHQRKPSTIEPNPDIFIRGKTSSSKNVQKKKIIFSGGDKNVSTITVICFTDE